MRVSSLLVLRRGFSPTVTSFLQVKEWSVPPSPQPRGLPVPHPRPAPAWPSLTAAIPPHTTHNPRQAFAGLTVVPEAHPRNLHPATSQTRSLGAGLGTHHDIALVSF